MPEQQPIPSRAADTPLIRVAATGIICGTGVKLAHGTRPVYAAGRASYPLTSGQE